MRRLVSLALTLTLGLSSHAVAQDIAFAELHGHTVTASFVYAQKIRRLDDGRIINNQNQQTVTLKIGPGERLDQTHAVRIIAPNGREVGSDSRSMTLQLNKPSKWRHGEIIWVYEKAALVRLQTFESGGRRITVSFKRNGPGFACSVEAPFAKEEGSGDTKTQAAVGGTKITILDARQTSSSCRVARTA